MARQIETAGITATAADGLGVVGSRAMSEPRPIVPGRTYMVTRRCAQRQFLLLPTEEAVTPVFLYCLTVAADMFNVEVHAFCVLSNHYHLVVTDRDGKLPPFMHWLNLHVSKALNVEYDRGESFWSSAPYSAVHLVNREDVLDKVVYTITNPVSSWLVSRAERWPGLITLPSNLASRVFQATRPTRFFRENGPCPEQLPLALEKPPDFDDATDEEFRRLVAERVAAKELELGRQRRAEGKGFLGRKKLRWQKRTDTPTSSASVKQQRAGITPRVACKDKWRRIERLGQLVGFRQAHRAALAAWRKGNRSVKFPAGTYLMRVQHGVACAPT